MAKEKIRKRFFDSRSTKPKKPEEIDASDTSRMSGESRSSDEAVEPKVKQERSIIPKPREDEDVLSVEQDDSLPMITSVYSLATCFSGEPHQENLTSSDGSSDNMATQLPSVEDVDNQSSFPGAASSNASRLPFVVQCTNGVITVCSPPRTSTVASLGSPVSTTQSTPDQATLVSSSTAVSNFQTSDLLIEDNNACSVGTSDLPTTLPTSEQEQSSSDQLLQHNPLAVVAEQNNSQYEERILDDQQTQENSSLNQDVPYSTNIEHPLITKQDDRIRRLKDLLRKREEELERIRFKGKGDVRNSSLPNSPPTKECQLIIQLLGKNTTTCLDTPKSFVERETQYKGLPSTSTSTGDTTFPQSESSVSEDQQLNTEKRPLRSPLDSEISQPALKRKSNTTDTRQSLPDSHTEVFTSPPPNKRTSATESHQHTLSATQDKYRLVNVTVMKGHTRTLAVPVGLKNEASTLPKRQVKGTSLEAKQAFNKVVGNTTKRRTSAGTSARPSKVSKRDACIQISPQAGASNNDTMKSQDYASTSRASISPNKDMSSCTTQASEGSNCTSSVTTSKNPSELDNTAVSDTSVSSCESKKPDTQGNNVVTNSSVNVNSPYLTFPVVQTVASIQGQTSPAKTCVLTGTSPVTPVNNFVTTSTLNNNPPKLNFSALQIPANALLLSYPNNGHTSVLTGTNPNSSVTQASTVTTGAPNSSPPTLNLSTLQIPANAHLLNHSSKDPTGVLTSPNSFVTQVNTVPTGVPNSLPKQNLTILQIPGNSLLNHPNKIPTINTNIYANHNPYVLLTQASALPNSAAPKNNPPEGNPAARNDAAKQTLENIRQQVLALSTKTSGQGVFPVAATIPVSEKPINSSPSRPMYTLAPKPFAKPNEKVVIYSITKPVVGAGPSIPSAQPTKLGDGKLLLCNVIQPKIAPKPGDVLLSPVTTDKGKVVFYVTNPAASQKLGIMRDNRILFTPSKTCLTSKNVLDVQGKSPVISDNPEFIPNPDDSDFTKLVGLEHVVCSLNAN